MHSEQSRVASSHSPGRSRVLAGHPCFVGAFVTDLVYWRSTSFIWGTFSVWLITAALIMAVFAAMVGLVDFAANRRIREFRPAWYHLFGNALVIVLSVINVFVHSRDGYTAVVPTGLILSGLVALILIGNGLDGLGNGLSRPCRSSRLMRASINSPSLWPWDPAGERLSLSCGSG
jgi:uncharacterized membrane protein